jgi:predicted transposase/invertase (TIGR01784 family)
MEDSEWDLDRRGLARSCRSLYPVLGLAPVLSRGDVVMILGISPKVDYAFKHLFGRESTRPILINLIDSVLNPRPGQEIQNVELLNPFNPKEALDDKLSILDVKARDQSGRQFNVEMQMLAFPYYEKRILYYWAKFYQQHIHEGQDYLDLKATISISFLDHLLFPRVPDYHLRFRLLEESHHFPFAADIEFHVLELPKFTKSADELVSGLDIWLYFFCHAEKMDIDALPAALQQHPLVRRALEELIVFTQTDQERERYEARRKAQLDDQTRLRVAHMEGREEGLHQGRTEGEQIGAIHAYEQLLNRPLTPTDQLAILSLEELTRLTEDLQAQVLKLR